MLCPTVYLFIANVILNMAKNAEGICSVYYKIMTTQVTQIRINSMNIQAFSMRAANIGKDISGLNSPRAPLACRTICTSSGRFSQKLDLRKNTNNDRFCRVKNTNVNKSTQFSQIEVFSAYYIFSLKEYAYVFTIYKSKNLFISMNITILINKDSS